MNFLNFVMQEWLLVSGLAILIMIYSWSERLKSGVTISTHELTALLNSEKAVVLDIRATAEYKAGHLVDAINIPHDKINSDLVSLEKYKTKIIIVVDKMGQHSGHIGRLLSKQGYDVRRLSGGISEWQSQNLPLIKSK